MSDAALGLLAEIERLRKELDYLSNQRRLDNGDLARAYDMGRDTERAATVAWLRLGDANWTCAAGCIERGEHRRVGKP